MRSLLLHRTDTLAVVLVDSRAGKRGDMPALYVYGKSGKADACPATCSMYDKGCYARSGREGLLERNAWTFAVVQGPLATSVEIRALVRGRLVRSAAIGDLGMVAAAEGILARLAQCGAAGTVGYTHTGRRLAGHMQSVESLATAREHWAHGRRTFRVLPHTAQPWKGRNSVGEVACPAWSGTATCDKCKLCDGKPGKPSVAIAAHGTQAKSIAG